MKFMALYLLLCDSTIYFLAYKKSGKVATWFIDTP